MPTDVTRQAGIPVTSPGRTIADLRRVLPADHLRAAIRRAEVLRLDIGAQPDYEPDLTRSQLERRFLDVCRRHGLPPPEVIVRVGSYWVDFLWRDRGLIVETDGFEHHGTRTAFESDRERGVELRLLGFETHRFTHRQVSNEPVLAAKLSALLDATA
jgi:hypothetical protein